jgi:predicted phage terminase large subunit-like protein
MFKYWNQRPEGLYVGMAVDLAISEARTADSTAITLLGMDHEWKLYVLDYLKGRWKPGEIVDNIFQMQGKWKPHVVGMETNGFQRTLKLSTEEEMRRRRTYFPIEEIKTGTGLSKESRIKSLEPFYRNGSVSHAAWMKGKDLETELQTFPKGKHDDLIDSMAMCLPLLHPGTIKTTNQEDDWDRAVKLAHANMDPFRGYFQYGS